MTVNWLSHLEFAKLEFLLEATQPLHLPEYKGSTFRGAFGNIFKNVVCIKEDRVCETCILTRNCSYHYVFETPNPGRFTWFSSPKLPHPYVLEPPLEERETFAPGERLSLNLILFGRAIELLPYFIFVFEDMGARGGVGKYRGHGFGRFALREVRDAFAPGRTVYDGAQKVIVHPPVVQSGSVFLNDPPAPALKSVQLDFLTPTRIKHKGEFLLFRSRGQLSAPVLLQNLYRRAFLMTFSHSDSDPPDFELPEFEDVLCTDAHLRWQDWERYSARQQRRHPLGGFVGQVTLVGNVAPWLPLLRIGELLHAGSASSFGLGRFSVQGL